jgi:hypothetical protein
MELMKNSLLLLLCFLFLSACSKDDNPVDSAAGNISTSWKLSKILVNGTSIPLPYSNTVLNFESNKTFECDEYMTGTTWAPYYGTWEMSNGKLNLIYDQNYGNKRNTNESYTYSVGGDKLILTGSNVIADYSLSIQIPDNSTTIQEYTK